MSTHRDAESLKQQDLFDLAGNHCIVLETYELVDPKMITVAFTRWDGNRRFKMTIPRDFPFLIINR